MFNLIPRELYSGNYEDDAKKLKILIWLFRWLFVVLFVGCIALTPDDNHQNKITKKSADKTYLKTSFDCSKANTYIEKTICTDSDLAKLDIELSDSYQSNQAKTKSKQKLKSQQKDWVQNIENSCTSKQCLADVINARIAVLNKK